MNSTCLQPSPAGHILFHSTAVANNCSSSRVGHQSNICAHTLTNLTKMTMNTSSEAPDASVTTSVKTTPSDTTMSTTTTMETTTTMTHCWTGLNSEDYCTISATSAGGFLVLVFLCCLLVVLPVCVCVRRRRRRRGKMEVNTAYKMRVENTILSHNISLEDITCQPATPEQDSTTFNSTETVEEPYIPKQGPRVLRSNIDQPVLLQAAQHDSSTTSPFKVSADKQPQSCSIGTTPTTVVEQPPTSVHALQRSSMDWEVDPMTIDAPLSTLSQMPQQSLSANFTTMANFEQPLTSLQTTQNPMATLMMISEQTPHEGHIKEPEEYLYPLGTSGWVSGSRVVSDNKQEGRDDYEHLNPSSMYESMYSKSTFLKIAARK